MKIKVEININNYEENFSSIKIYSYEASNKTINKVNNKVNK